MRHPIFVVLLFAVTAARGADLRVEPAFDTSKWLARSDTVELKLSRVWAAEEGRPAIFVGPTDVTTLFEVTSSVVRKRSGSMPLPAGEHQMVVYRVKPDGTWEELLRTPLKILTVRGFEKAVFKPSFDISSQGQFDQEQNPEQSFGGRESYQDATLLGGLTHELQRGDTAFLTQANVTGVSHLPQALRYGEKGENAPRFDLSNYKMELRQGTTQVALGHVSHGSQRHLINGFGSRGVTLTFGVGRPLFVSFGVMNGTSIVGWDNFLGVQNEEHQMLSGTIGFELVPKRPGNARLEASLLRGSLRPVDSFNQGSIRSAEKSRGGAIRLVLSNSSRRINVDAGVTRSRFEPAHDPQLEAGLPTVELSEQERDAAYLDASVVLLQNRPISKSQFASMSMSLAFERVEPMFRSVAASSQADIQRGTLSLTGSLGPLTLQLGHSRIEDNLDGIDSILKTRTEGTTASVGLTMSTLFGARRYSRLIPVLTATASRIHQYGDGIPANSGFSASHVPDQMSTSGQASIEWHIARLRFGYRASLSDQDNRQPGRERSDFKADTGTIFFTVNPTDRIDVTLENALEHQRNIEFAQLERVQRHGVNLSWRVFRDFAVATNYSVTFGRDGRRTNEREASEGFLELSNGFRLWTTGANRNQSRVYVRLSTRDSEAFDDVFGISTVSDGWALSSGLNVSLY